MHPRTLVRAAVLLAVTLPAPALAGPGPQTHLHWLHKDDTSLGHVHLTRVNGDQTPDAIVVGGDRLGYTVQTPCSPASAAHLAADTASQPVPGIAALDGVNGDVLWEVAWDTGGLAHERPTRTHVQMLEGAFDGDLDGDGSPDLLILRSALAVDRSEIVQKTTMYDPRTGALRWETSRTLPGNVFAFRTFQPIDVFGTPGGMIARVTVDTSLQFHSEVELVTLEPGTPPETFFQVPTEAGNGSLPLATPYGDGIRVISFIPHITFPPPAVTIDIRTEDVVLDEDDQPEVLPAWERVNGGGGLPAVVTGGSDPAIVLGQGSIVALNLADGSPRWVAPVDVSPQGGTFIEADVNADGVRDVVASPAFGPERTGLFTGGFFAELVALDGRTGAQLWRTEDPAAKFRAWGMSTADIDGNGSHELVASMVQQEGFAMCAMPGDDPGVLAVFDLATGEQACRLVTDRWAVDVAPANLDAEPGEELVAATAGGNTYSFRDEEPGCGTLGLNPLGP